MTWWQILLSVLTVSVSYLAARRGTRDNREATKQREYQAGRDDWLKRFTYAVDAATSGNQLKAVVGIEMLGDLVKSPFAGDADKRLARTASRTILAEIQSVRDSGEIEPATADDGTEEGT